MNDETAPQRPYRFIGKPLPRREDERLVSRLEHTVSR